MEKGDNGLKRTPNRNGDTPFSSTSLKSHDREKEKMNKEDDGRKSNIPFYKLFLFADFTDIILMTLGTLAAIGNGISMPLMTVIFGNLIDSFGKTTDNDYVVHEVSKVVQMFVYLGMATGVVSFLQVACWMTTAERQAARIRNLYLKTILRQDIAFFDKETNAGEVVGRMSGDNILIQDAMGEKVGKCIQLASSFLAGFTIAFIRGWLLTLVMISVIPLIVLSAGIMSIVISRMASRGQTAYSEAATIVEQTVGSIRTVASFTGERKASNKYNKSLKKAYKASVQEGLAAGIGLGSSFSIIFFGYALGVWFGSKMILNEGYTGGRVLSVIFALFTGSFSLGQASPCISAFGAGKAAAYKMFKTMERKPEIDAYNTSGIKLHDIQGEIEFIEVSFSYPARMDEKVLDGFCLSIPSGKTMALVGESGSGKSTIISLIERFYEPQAGEVLIDGINLKDFQLRWIREKIGLVSQEPILFTSSIRDNITYGKDNATAEEIKAAIELANASKFIDKMPQGLDTMVGDRGTHISGGQKQRIAIARAILKDPRILLLDEATSALDTESEQIVQNALDRVMANRTTVIVAHRLTTVRNVDTIAVVRQGSVMEKGSHLELVSNPNGAYSQLLHFQEKSHDTEDILYVQDNISVVAGRVSSQHASFRRSTSQGSSLGNSGHHSFSVLPSFPMELDIDGNKMQQSSEELSKAKSHVPVWRLACLNKPELPVILLGVIAAVINGVLLPIFGTFLSCIIQMFYESPEKLQQDSKHWSLMFIILGSTTLVAIPARSYFFAVAGSKLIERIRSMSFEKVINMEIRWYDDLHNSRGSISARLSADAAIVRSLVGDALALVVQNTATFLAGLVVAFSACWQLALIILALVPLIGLNGWVQLKYMKGFSADLKIQKFKMQQMMYEEASQVANDAVGNIRTVASFSAEEKVMELYKKKCEGPSRMGIRQGITSGVGFGFSLLVVFCAYAISFYAGARLIEDQKTTFTKVFRVFFALNMAAVGISQSSSLAPDSTKAKSATTSIFAILDQKSAIDPSNESGTMLQKVKGNIDFQYVSFRYPTRPEVKIFQDFCLAIQSGQTVALVGESGSGKSTAISLLQRFYDPDSGQILLDGIEIQKFRLRWLRQQMGLVNQEPVLFNDTIRNNIAYGKELNATEAEIVEASKSANAHTFISGLHQGYDTVVGERGVQLSGGQKQRVAIARAIVKEPRILLLDEATSALDNESERVVQDALDQVMRNRTTLVVAHRLSTIKGADLIAVIKNGIVIEKGKHEDLLNIQDGAYASLISSNRKVHY